MPRFTQNLFAAFAAVMIMAGSFGAIVTVPPAQAQAALVTPTLA
ncbi:hypothetical protein WAB17_04750 [Parerythrobacter aurantius]